MQMSRRVEQLQFENVLESVAPIRDDCGQVGVIHGRHACTCTPTDSEKSTRTRPKCAQW
jgi:hypothetical protein